MFIYSLFFMPNIVMYFHNYTVEVGIEFAKGTSVSTLQTVLFDGKKLIPKF